MIDASPKLELILAPKLERLMLNLNDSNTGEPFEGYTLFAPMWDTKTYLIDNDGKVYYTWKSVYTDTQASYLLENGNLVRTSLVSSQIFSGGAQGRIEMFN